MIEELSKLNIIQKYAKYLPEQKRRETWDEIVDRSLNMHLRKFHFLKEEEKKEIVEAFRLVREKKVLPSMRSAQFAGPAIEAKNERIFNCCALHIKDVRSIEKAFYLLLCGVGCGFGLQKQYVNQFPKVTQFKLLTTTFVIEDSIEGWAQSVGVLINSFLEGNEWSNKNIEFDYSKIRPKGAPISHGGVAPGPSGLKFAHEKIRKLLQSVETEKLTTLHVYDILMHTADAVLSGGIRRAACVALFDKDDVLMATAKIGAWFKENPQRARSNNTTFLERSTTTFEEFYQLFRLTKEFGEPGIAFVNVANKGLWNPCLEIGLTCEYDGQPAVQFCNLTSINGNKVQVKEDFFKYAEAAALIGTLQASYTDFPFLDEGDKKITEEEALLGVSVLGWMANPDVLLVPEIMQEAYQVVKKTNEIWAEKIGINPAARLTCVKPDGNSSCVLESAFAGIHPAHSKRYIRRVQINKDDAIFKYFQQFNPQACEESVYSATGTDAVISFPIIVENEHAIFKDDLSATAHLEIIKSVQLNWVNGGEASTTSDINHAVSCTVVVDESEWDEVAQYLFDNRNYFTNVSLLPKTGDKDYAQAPYEACRTDEELDNWEELYRSFVSMNYTNLIEVSDDTKFTAEVACQGGVCTL